MAPRVAQALRLPFHAQAFSSEQLEGGDAALERNAGAGGRGGFSARKAVREVG